MEIQI